jgi:Dyp-type peroxidase family
MTAPTTDRPKAADAADIQGNLVGFNKDHQRLIFVQFPSEAAAQALLTALHPELSSASDVLKINADYKKIVVEEGKDPLTIQSTWVNLVISFSGLAVLNPDGISTFPTEFQQGMWNRVQSLGDVDASAPSNWIPPFTSPSVVHAMIIVAADLPAGLDARTQVIADLIVSAGATELGRQDGNTRPGSFKGHEHFGFKDGISQPSIRGLTTSSKGGDVIAAGEFLIGYEDQDGNVSGAGVPAPPQQGQPGYNPIAPTEPVPALPPWTRNGSFMVYRRLQQNVQAFQDFIAEQATAAGFTSPEQLGAKLLGRWPSGAPLEHVPGERPPIDPAQADPSAADPRVLADDHINNFAYQVHDADGHIVPRAAHIRKSYPRDENPPGADEANRHRVIRRGIPYGNEFQAQEQPYPPTGPIPADQDRGLLFGCYQASIIRGFEFVQTQWANVPDFPQAGDGNDPVISQNSSAPFIGIPPSNPHLALARWVTTTGGEYFFAPAISAVQHLVGPVGSS